MSHKTWMGALALALAAAWAGSAGAQSSGQEPPKAQAQSSSTAQIAAQARPMVDIKSPRAASSAELADPAVAACMSGFSGAKCSFVDAERDTVQGLCRATPRPYLTCGKNH